MDRSVSALIATCIIAQALPRPAIGGNQPAGEPGCLNALAQLLGEVPSPATPPRSANNLKVIQEVSTTLESLPKTPRTTALLMAHRSFVREGGVILIEPSFVEYPMFLTPDPLDAEPIILLTSMAEITDGSYKHELDHFRDWLFTKKALLRKGFSETTAHTALGDHRSQSPSKLARSIQWTEDRATNTPGTYAYETNAGYAQIEAIRALADSEGFTKEIGTRGSSLRIQVIDYVKEAYRKQVLRKPDWRAGDILYFAEDGRPDQVLTDAFREYSDSLKSELETDLDPGRMFAAELPRFRNPEKLKALQAVFSGPELAGHRRILIRRRLEELRNLVRQGLSQFGYSPDRIDAITSHRPRT